MPAALARAGRALGPWSGSTGRQAAEADEPQSGQTAPAAVPERSDTVGDVSERRWAGSRITGAGPAEAVSSYPGERLGLQERGSGAVAGYGARFVALLIDWALCTIIALAALHSQWWTYAIFAVEVYLLTALTGFTVGKRLLRLRVVRLDGKPVGFAWAFVRTVLLLAVIPAFVVDRDMRGLHDRAANTVVVRM